MIFYKQVCVIVDAYSTGQYLASALTGYKCIHIQSSKNIPKEMTAKLKKDDFIENIIFTGDVKAVLEKLSVYQVKLCIAGSESGVMVADQLSEALNLPSNGTKYSEARRNKYLMTNVVAESGLKTVKHIHSDSAEAITNWAKGLKKEDFPIVIKPMDSASGDNVHFCRTDEEIASAFKKVIEAKNLFGEENKVALAQSFNVGVEYIVNTVSWEKQHFTVEIWRVKKKPHTAIYDTCELVHADDEEYAQLVGYTFKVLDALHIQYGAGTTELKYTKENGPVLIECAARLMGAAEIAYSQEIFGYSQLSLLVEAYLNPSAFWERFSVKKKSIEKCALAVFLISDAEGILYKELSLVNYAKQLTTFYSFDMAAEQGSKINITTDMLSSPGIIYLLGTKEKVYEDYKAIRTLEEKSIYKESVKPGFEPSKVITEAKDTFKYKISVSHLSPWCSRHGLVLTKADLALNSGENSKRLLL